MQILAMLGETVQKLVQTCAKPFDGSYVGVQTDKGSYTAGEVIQGCVVLQNNSQRPVDRVMIKISVKEKVHWDEEISRTQSSGEGPDRKTWTEYSHHRRAGKTTHLKELVCVSQVPHLLAPGSYSYPFQYILRPDLPGSARFFKKHEASDPAWRGNGRQLETSCEITFKIKAFVAVNDVFSRDIRSEQEIVVNPAFSWSSMNPAFGEKRGQVLFCCCFPRGEVRLQAQFDRAAYMAGETAGIKATIKNDSEQDVSKMSVRLVRSITLKSDGGERKSVNDVMCKNSYPGVRQKACESRDLPLPLHSAHGPLMPGTKGRLMEIKYTFVVGCDLSCAPDIEVHLPMIIFAPPPTLYGLAALGLATPQGMAFSFTPSSSQGGFIGSGVGAGTMPQQQQQQQYSSPPPMTLPSSPSHYQPQQQQQQPQQQPYETYSPGGGGGHQQPYYPQQQQQEQQQQQQGYQPQVMNPAYGAYPSAPPSQYPSQQQQQQPYAPQPIPMGGGGM